MQYTLPNIVDVLKHGRDYTGIGSRKCPIKIQYIMEDVAKKLTQRLFVLRSGGAEGADKAFERGSGYSSIYYASDATDEAMAIAAMYHPAWDRLSDYAKRLHGRNAFQVLGAYLKNPSEFVICWTQDGAICHEERTIKTGGTGTAISIASKNNIPVYNLKRKDHLERITNWIK